MESACSYCQLPVRLRRDQRLSKREPVYCCFGCKFAADITQARGEQGHVTWMLTRLGIAVFLSMSVMIFSLYLYGRDIYASPADNGSAVSSALTGFMRYASLLFATPVLFLLGGPILANSIDQWRRRIASTDALIVLGVGAAYVYSYAATISETGQTYFETACMVLVLVTLGRWLEAIAKLRASDAVRVLDALLPSSVIVERDGGRETVPVERLCIGDLLFIPAGQRIAVDGIIESGQAQVDNHIVTGESKPVSVVEGQTVHAGATALDGALHVRATAVGADSTIGRIEALLAAARQTKSRYERLADRVASWFIALTVMVALVAAGVAFIRIGIDEAIVTLLAVLLIACPCALGIATPTAVWAALGHAARMGALFRNGECIERLASTQVVCFDKTGTLTAGTANVESVTTDGMTQREMCIGIAAGLAAGSTHVVSRSIFRFAKRESVVPIEHRQLRTAPGRGIFGIGVRGEASLGSPAYMHARGLVANERIGGAIAALAQAGTSNCCVGWDGCVRAVFAVGESLRAEARSAIGALASQGIEVLVLTGDHASRGTAIEKRLGTTVIAELMPEEKAEHISRLQLRHGVVAMVGDGINDSPALAVADIGLAMGCGADIARDSADVCLIGDDLDAIPRLILLARQTVRTIRVNLFWAFAFNTVGMSLAAAGLLSPIIAAGAMVISSLFVVGNSIRLATSKDASSEARTEPGRRMPQGGDG